MKRVAFFVLIAAVLIQGAALIVLYRGQKAELTELRVVAHRRNELCNSYRSFMRGVQNDLAHHSHEIVTQRALVNYQLLASPTFFAACEIDGKKLEPELERARECYLKNADYRCIADVAGEVIKALPSSFD